MLTWIDCSLNYMGPNSNVVNISNTPITWTGNRVFAPQKSFDTADLEAFNVIIGHMGLVDGGGTAIPTANPLDPLYGYNVPAAWWGIMDFTDFTKASPTPHRIKELNISGLASETFKNSWANDLGGQPDGILDIKALGALVSLDVSGNGLLTLDVTGLAGLTRLDVSDNVLPNTGAIVGMGNVADFVFDRQYYMLTVTGGEITGVMEGGVEVPDAASNFTDRGIYRQGTGVCIVADPPEPGYEFKNWKSAGGGSFADAGEENTTFTMPKGYADVTAVFGLETEYNEEDVNIINGLILDYGLALTEDDPEGWETAGAVTWSLASTNKRVIGLNLNGKNLGAGSTPPTLDVSGLIMLRTLDVGNNELTGLELSGLNLLTALICGENLLETLDLTGLRALTALDCSYNYLTGSSPFTGLADTAFTEWGQGSFTIYPQYYELSRFRADGGTIAVSSGKEGKSGFYPAGSEVTLTAGSPVTTGQGLSHWTSDYAGDPENEAFDPKDKSPTTFTMPEKAVTVTAHFATLYNIDDIAAMNAVIASNPGAMITGWAGTASTGGSLTANPWPFVSWSDAGVNKRITGIDISGEGATGTLTVSGLTGFGDLESLDVSGNKFTSLTVSSLAGLKTLDCSDNLLTALSLSALGELTVLDCSDNALTAGNISGLTGLTKLEELYLRENLITGLSIAALSLLKTLDVRGNRIPAEINVLRPAGLVTFLFDEQYYELVIENGSVKTAGNAPKDNWYLKGTAITAEADTGTSSHGFASWTAVGLDISGQANSLEITFTMPGNKVELTANYAALYNTVDIEVINRIIANNGLDWTAASPANGTVVPSDWTGVTWSGAHSGKRITALDVSGENLTGTLNMFMAGTPGWEILTLDCSDNFLIGVTVTGQAALTALNVSDNLLQSTGYVTGATNANIPAFTAWGQGGFIYGQQYSLLTVEGGIIVPSQGAPYQNGVNYIGEDIDTGKFRSSETVYIKADQPEPGDEFKNWTIAAGSGGSFGSTSNASTTFTMPSATGSLMTIRAVFGAQVNAEYNPGDVAVINAIIEKNGLAWEKADPTGVSPLPSSWAGAIWTESPGSLDRRIRSLNLANQNLMGAMDVSGLAHLMLLTVNNNSLTSINISGLTGLTQLNVANNKLQSLDASNLSALEQIRCQSNNLTWLDVTDCFALEYLWCNDNYLQDENDVIGIEDIIEFIYNGWDNTSFRFYPQNTAPVYDIGDVSFINTLIANSGLSWTPAANYSTDPGWSGVTWSNDPTWKRIKTLDLSGEELKGTLDLRALTALASLNCQNNELTGLNLTGLTLLAGFDLRYNFLTQDAVTGAEDTLVFTGGQGWSDSNVMFSPQKSFSLADIAAINDIIINKGLQGSLTPANQNQLDTGITVPADWLTVMEFSPYIISPSTPRRLVSLDLSGLGMTGTLDVSAFDALTSLNVSGNALTGLTLTGLTALNDLDCGGNVLAALNLSGLSALTDLKAGGNALTALNLSGLAALATLDVSENRLTALDVSASSAWTAIDVSGNRMANENAVTPNGTYNWGTGNYKFHVQYYELEITDGKVTGTEPAQTAGWF